MEKRGFRWGGAVLLGMLLAVLLSAGSLAAAGPEQINFHVGGTAGTVYLTYADSSGEPDAISLSGGEEELLYTSSAAWSEDAGKYLHTAVLTDLGADTVYTCAIGGTDAGTFRTAPEEGAFTFAFLTDVQVAGADSARAVGALFGQLEDRADVDFTYLAGDFTDSPRRESQWEMLFAGGGGVYDGAGQAFFGSHLIAAAQGNHDNRTFAGHITTPSAGAAGETVYAFDWSNVTFIVLNLSNADAREAQAEFLRARVAEARAADRWVVVGFHQSLYPGAAHVVDDIMIEARKFWSPLLDELGVDVVLQGHDHVYARGFVTGTGKNAAPAVVRNGYHTGAAPLYLTGGESGATKWYAAKKSYRISAGDPIVPNYGFLDVNSAVPAQNPWGTDTSVTREQTYTVVEVDGDVMTFSVYMFRYDGKTDRMVTAPYLYDSLILRRGEAAQADLAALDLGTTEAPAAGYGDVAEGSWYDDAVDYVTAEGLLDGRSAELFAPGEALTRGEAAEALYRLAGSPRGPWELVFPDVAEGDPLCDAAAWAAEAGVLQGMPDGSFAPEAAITRAQLTVMLQRYVQSRGEEPGGGLGVGTYADWRQAADWCRPALSWAVETGLLQGKEGNRLAPQDQVTRAEGAVLLQRLALLAA